MVKLRLSRAGRKKAPVYKIVAADSRARRDGKFIESIGQYDPSHNPAKVILKEDRALYWLGTGAQPTVTVKNLFSRRGLMMKHHLLKKGADASKIESEINKWSQKQEARIAKQAERKLKLKEKKKKAAAKTDDNSSEGNSQESAASEEQSG